MTDLLIDLWRTGESGQVGAEPAGEGRVDALDLLAVDVVQLLLACFPGLEPGQPVLVLLVQPSLDGQPEPRDGLLVAPVQVHVAQDLVQVFDLTL